MAQALSVKRRPPGTDESRPAVIRRLLILVALYAIPCAALVKPVTDPDIWWHLATGQWVVEHATVPGTDPFSAYGQARPWVAYSWLFEVSAYSCYRALGLMGLVVLRLLMAAAVLVAVHRLVIHREPRFIRATLLTAVAYFALVPLLNERPWLFTILFTVLTLDTVLRLRDGMPTRAVWLLPLAYMLWANLHIQFVYGLAVLGLACLAPLIDALRAECSFRETLNRGWRLVGLSAACAAATLVNPYGARLYTVIYEYASQTVPFQHVQELQAPPFRLPYEWAFLALAGAATFALGRRQQFSGFDLLLLAGATVAGFRARRDLWLVVVAALALLTSGPRLAETVREFALTPRRIAVVAAGVMLFLFLMALHRDLTPHDMTCAVAREYPVRAVEHVKEAGYAGPLFNDLNWGGFLIWALPDHAVSMDGRTNLHGNERLARHVNTTHAIRYQDDPDLMTARLVILERDSALASVLRLHPRFTLRYEDLEDGDAVRAVVFTARDEGPGRRPSRSSEK
jgi:hypothetical protein